MSDTTETITETTAVDGAETQTDVAASGQQQQTYDDGLDEFRHENGKIFGKFVDAKNLPKQSKRTSPRLKNTSLFLTKM